MKAKEAEIAALNAKIEGQRAKLKDDIPYWWNVFASMSKRLSEEEKTVIRRAILDYGATISVKQVPLKSEQTHLQKLERELAQRKAQETQRLMFEQIEKERRERVAQEKANAEARQRAAAEYVRQKAAQEAKEKAAREEAVKREAARKQRMAEEEAARRKREAEIEADLGAYWEHHANSGSYNSGQYGKKTKGDSANRHRHHNHTSEMPCSHHGWWSKLQGRHECPHCTRPLYTFALQCPGCAIIACAACRPVLQAGGKPTMFDHSKERPGASPRRYSNAGRKGRHAPAATSSYRYDFDAASPPSQFDYNDYNWD